MERISVISNLAVTTGIAVGDIPQTILFLRESLNLNKLPSLEVDLKITSSL